MPPLDPSKPFAVLSHIAGCFPALEAVQADAQAQGVEQFVWLGASVGRWPFSSACLEAAANGALVLRNYIDDVALEDPEAHPFGWTALMAAEVMKWTKRQLRPEERRQIADWPTQVDIESMRLTTRPPEEHCEAAPSLLVASESWGSWFPGVPSHGERAEMDFTYELPRLPMGEAVPLADLRNRVIHPGAAVYGMYLGYSPYIVLRPESVEAREVWWDAAPVISKLRSIGVLTDHQVDVIASAVRRPGDGR